MRPPPDSKPQQTSSDRCQSSSRSGLAWMLSLNGTFNGTLFNIQVMTLLKNVILKSRFAYKPVLFIDPQATFRWSVTSSIQHEWGHLQQMADLSGPEAHWEVWHLIKPNNDFGLLTVREFDDWPVIREADKTKQNVNNPNLQTSFWHQQEKVVTCWVQVTDRLRRAARSGTSPAVWSSGRSGHEGNIGFCPETSPRWSAAPPLWCSPTDPSFSEWASVNPLKKYYCCECLERNKSHVCVCVTCEMMLQSHCGSMKYKSFNCNAGSSKCRRTPGDQRVQS